MDEQLIKQLKENLAYHEHKACLQMMQVQFHFDRIKDIQRQLNGVYTANNKQDSRVAQLITTPGQQKALDRVDRAANRNQNKQDSRVARILDGEDK